MVAAVIERGGRLLLGLRPAEKRHGGLWEFPGGKLDGAETAAEAAHRELKEELSVVVTAVGERLTTIREEGSPFVIEFYPVVVEGEPKAIEHKEVRWFSLDELSEYSLAPADTAFATWLAADRLREV
uniref:8-oxo-dGTP diphosphatase n=1 Tax=uncultured marine bacterium Ant4D5 TaxID=360428 RepID=Q2PXZ7_9BACT|nr:nudix family protein, MutT subfamily [uncultured marine bacterium Ant4D5]